MEATPPKHIFYQMYQQAKIQIKWNEIKNEIKLKLR
jgi:hypothetical protein